MDIVEATLTVPDVDHCARWFAQTLALPVRSSRDDEGNHAVVTLGRSALVLRAGPPTGGSHHLAFSVRPEDLGLVMAFARASLSPVTVDGSDMVEGPAGWDSRSVYFHGPGGLLLEYIAREAHRGRLPDTPGTVGAAPAVLSLNEVGTGVADVPAAVGRLAAEAGLLPYPPQGPDFAPVGDEDGLLVLVAPGWTWFPTDGAGPSTGPLVVTIAAPAGPDLSIGEHTVVRRSG